MISPQIKLSRLRGVFIAYFVLKSVIGAVVAAIVLKPVHFSRLGRFGWRDFSAGSLVFLSLMVAAVILVIALLIFGQLLLRRNWARVLLLVIGWLTVIGAVFSLLASTQMGELGSWLSRLAPDAGLDWQDLLQYDRVQKVFELLFWGYLISVLQFDPGVTREFQPPAASGEPGKE